MYTIIKYVLSIVINIGIICIITVNNLGLTCNLFNECDQKCTHIV